jgi:hypothetical protein
MPPPSLPPPSVPPPIKVVKGVMQTPPPRTPSRGRPVDDLFAEEPTPQPTDLFTHERQLARDTDSHSAREPSGDLFEPPKSESKPDLFQEARARREQDLFQEEPTPPSGRNHADLFVPPSERASDEATVGDDHVHAEDLLRPIHPIEQPERSADLPELEPVEILPNDPLYEPMAPPSRKMEIPDEATVSEQPAVMPPDYEVSNPEIPVPSFADWDGVTNDDVLLTNQPVISEVEIPDIPDLRAQPKKEEDTATLMVSRNDLFVDEVQRDDLVRWGDERPILESHPEFAASEKGQLDGEDMPLASHSMVNLPAVSRDEAARAASFHRTLAAIRERAERADLPDRDELLGAIDLLEHHAYVRVALAMIEREDR